MACLVRGSVVVLEGADCLVLAPLLARGLREQTHRDGGVPPRLTELLESVLVGARVYRAEVLAGSENGTPGFRDDVSGASSVSSVTWLTVERTAQLLGCSHEYVRRLLRQRELIGSRAGSKGAWRVDAASVVERLGARRTEAA
ncbi:helix-turn-helix domain-containing protein [Streptomyces sp. NPDC057403]|uniref:helix-turn-helix domain-containing protein n=1 Tax=Streptomyces sp. NPDC057403 TaxID=3346119 RepID=UPI0036880D79